MLGSFDDLVGEIDEDELLLAPSVLINQTVDAMPQPPGAKSFLVLKPASSQAFAPQVLAQQVKTGSERGADKESRLLENNKIPMKSEENGGSQLSQPLGSSGPSETTFPAASTLAKSEVSKKKPENI